MAANILSLESLYELPKPDGIAGFLEAHAELDPLLLEAAGKIRAVFGIGQRLSLRLFRESKSAG